MKVINLKFKTLVNCKLILNKKSLYQDKVKKKKKKKDLYIFICLFVFVWLERLIDS